MFIQISDTYIFTSDSFRTILNWRNLKCLGAIDKNYDALVDGHSHLHIVKKV